MESMLPISCSKKLSLSPINIRTVTGKAWKDLPAAAARGRGEHAPARVTTFSVSIFVKFFQ